MQNIQLGNFVLNGQLLQVLIFGVSGWLMLRIRHRNRPDRAESLAVISNAFIIWVLIWKASVFLFYSTETLKQPIAIVYFDGGARGMWLASVIAALYAGWRLRKLDRPMRLWLDDLVLYMLTGFLFAQVLPLVYGQGRIWQHATIALLCALLIVPFMRSAKEIVVPWLLKKNAVAFAIVAGLIIYAGYGYVDKGLTERSMPIDQSDAETGMRVGQFAPDFNLADMQGNEVRLSDFRGQKVLLNFWATWCPPCRVEMPYLQRFYEKDATDDIVVIAVNLTSLEKNTSRVEQFAQDKQLTFPILLDESGSVLNAFRITAYPTTYFLDSSGVIRHRFQGAMSYEMMRKLVSDLE